MNQATNLIQWKNLTDEQKAQFDFSRPELYMSQRSCGKVEWRDYKFDQPKDEIEEVFLEHVNRLKIVPDEWYYWRKTDGGYSGVITGNGLSDDIHGMDILRPAKPSEIPKPEPTLLERMGLKWPDKHIFLLKVNKKGLLSHDDSAHTKCQSMEDFIGYAYVDKENNEPFISLRPIHGTPFDKIGSKGIELPIAVLFGDFDR